MKPTRICGAITALLLLAAVAAHANEPPAGPRYGTFTAASNAARRVVSRALGAVADSAKWRRGTSAFGYRDQPRWIPDAQGKKFLYDSPRDTLARVPSLTMTLDMKSGQPTDPEIHDALERAGWIEDGRYSADGQDGTTFAFVCRQALCFIEGRWDGGDPTDTTYVPKPGYKLTLTCVPRPQPRPTLPRVKP